MTGLHTGIEVDLRRGWAYMLRRRVKLGVYVVAFAGCAVSQGLLHGTAEQVAELVIALAGAVGVHQAPNAKKR